MQGVPRLQSVEHRRRIRTPRTITVFHVVMFFPVLWSLIRSSRREPGSARRFRSVINRASELEPASTRIGSGTRRDRARSRDPLEPEGELEVRGFQPPAAAGDGPRHEDRRLMSADLVAPDAIDGGGEVLFERGGDGGDHAVQRLQRRGYVFLSEGQPSPSSARGRTRLRLVKDRSAGAGGVQLLERLDIGRRLER